MDYLGKLTRDGKQFASSWQLFVDQPDAIKDEDSFDFWNGDRYEGEYTATRNPLSIVREGKGTYFSRDGSVYAGAWSKDLLEEADEIIFPNKSRFSGLLENMVLEGPGAYKFKEGVEIRGYLMSNHFIGDLQLKDPTDHYWKALNPQNEHEVYFYPSQPFWQSILCKNQFLLTYGEGEEFHE